VVLQVVKGSKFLAQAINTDKLTGRKDDFQHSDEKVLHIVKQRKSPKS